MLGEKLQGELHESQSKSFLVSRYSARLGI